MLPMTYAMHRISLNFAPEIRGRLRDSACRQGRRRRHCGRRCRGGRGGDDAGGRRPVRERVLLVVPESLHVELKVQLARHHRVRHLYLKLLTPERPVACEIWDRNICLIYRIDSSNLSGLSLHFVNFDWFSWFLCQPISAWARGSWAKKAWQMESDSESHKWKLTKSTLFLIRSWARFCLSSSAHCEDLLGQ